MGPSYDRPIAAGATGSRAMEWQNEDFMWPLCAVPRCAHAAAASLVWVRSLWVCSDGSCPPPFSLSIAVGEAVPYSVQGHTVIVRADGWKRWAWALALAPSFAGFENPTRLNATLQSCPGARAPLSPFRSFAAHMRTFIGCWQLPAATQPRNARVAFSCTL